MARSRQLLLTLARWGRQLAWLSSTRSPRVMVKLVGADDRPDV